jgi:hypothetical protein
VRIAGDNERYLSGVPWRRAVRRHGDGAVRARVSAPAELVHATVLAVAVWPADSRDLAKGAGVGRQPSLFSVSVGGFK